MPQEPGDVIDAEPVVLSVAGGGDDDPGSGRHLLHEGPKGMAEAASPGDASVHWHADLRGALLDGFEHRKCGVAGTPEWRVERQRERDGREVRGHDDRRL